LHNAVITSSAVWHF